MGFLLKEALKVLCGSNQWSYAVFWKIGCQNSKLLIWEECHIESISAGIRSSEFPFGEWEGCWVSSENGSTHSGFQTDDRASSLINKMMLNNEIVVVGEGIVGRAAFSGKFLWINSNNFTRDHPPEVLNEVHQQFAAGMQTIAVIPILPHGVVQLGSSFSIMKNMGFVNDVKTLILQLGDIPGALLAEIFATKDPAENIRVPVMMADIPSQQGNSSQASVLVDQLSHSLLIQNDHHVGASKFQFSTPKSHHDICKPNHIFEDCLDNGEIRAEVIIPKRSWRNQQASASSRFSFQPGFSGSSAGEGQILSGAGIQHDGNNHIIASNNFNSSQLGISGGLMLDEGRCSVGTELLEGSQSHMGRDSDLKPFSSPRCLNTKRAVKNNVSSRSRFDGIEVQNSHPICTAPTSGDDLFDILGVEYKTKLLHGSDNVLLDNGADRNTQNLGEDHLLFLNMHEAGLGSDIYPLSEAMSDTGVFSIMGSDNLLDAVVSRGCSSAKQCSEDNVSCKTTLTRISSSSVVSDSPTFNWASTSNNSQSDYFILPKPVAGTRTLDTSSFGSGCSKSDAGKSCQDTSVYGSQISSWVEQGNNVKCGDYSVSTAYSKKPNEVNKSSRKRLKPGENPRPRPKDRQMIQDRVKELREIVPNGAKCSIDALLERTIKHMLFLQSVTKHADKLKQTGESKIISREGGLYLKDKFEGGGATWAFEVGSKSMVCPIIVEDLNPPRQMLVEMLCEERGFFLEIADLVRGLGLTILKGVMETRNDKIWAQFAVEANRDVTRMEIFMSLVHLLEQTMKGSAAANAIANAADDIGHMMVHNSFPQTAPIPAAGRPNGLL